MTKIKKDDICRRSLHRRCIDLEVIFCSLRLGGQVTGCLPGFGQMLGDEGYLVSVFVQFVVYVTRFQLSRCFDVPREFLPKQMLI